MNDHAGIEKFNDLLLELRTIKPNDRSEVDRYYAIVITEVEKAKATFLVYCNPDHFDGPLAEDTEN